MISRGQGDHANDVHRPDKTPPYFRVHRLSFNCQWCGRRWTGVGHIRSSRCFKCDNMVTPTVVTEADRAEMYNSSGVGNGQVTHSYSEGATAATSENFNNFQQSAGNA